MCGSFRSSARSSLHQRLRMTCEQIGQCPNRADRIVRLYEQALEVPVELGVVAITAAERENNLIDAGQRLLKLRRYRGKLTQCRPRLGIQVLDQSLRTTHGR